MEAGYELVVESILQQIIINVARHYLGAKSRKARQTDSIEQQHTISAKAHLIIEEAFLYDYKTITLEELAERVSLGVRQTERLLIKHYGHSFIQKRTEARMSAATQLLTETDLNISIIAEDLGYASSEHFTNAFKSFYKMSPTKYRKMNV